MFFRNYCRCAGVVCIAAATAVGVVAGEGDGDGAIKLPEVEVTAGSSVADQYRLPQASESITALRVQETINALDAEDTVKYLPSLFLRKRNYGDTQPTLATRVWGVSSSARSLVYADDILLTPLIANNNNVGAPRWGLVSPVEIERVDVMYGPFAAAYPGNSMGAVLEITTRMPEKRETGVGGTVAWQTFRLYGTDRTLPTRQGSVYFGDHVGRWSVWLSGNVQDSQAQPLSFVTAPSAPPGTTGAYAANNKLGQPANVVGATGLLRTRMNQFKVKAAYDLAPWLQGVYTFGFWRNRGGTDVDTYLRDAAGEPTFGGLAGFASGKYDLLQEHSMHSFALKSDSRAAWDFEANATWYRMDRDWQSQPNGVAGPRSFTTAGRVAVLGGTGWRTADLKGTWRSDVKFAAHTLGFGLHEDSAKLYNPTFTTADWREPSQYTGVATEGDGKTRTRAAWVQDVWQLTPELTLTLGARYEGWRAYDGLNRNGSTVVRQPDVNARRFSPKTTLAWRANARWQFSASIGQAYRFATPAELYQLVSTGSTFTAPRPDLKPDDVLAAEFKLERNFAAGRARLSLFQDEVRDAIIAQFNPLVSGSTQLYSFLANVDRVRARGAELVVDTNRLGVRGLSLSASVTYVDARTLALSGRPSANAPADAAIGKRLPNIPEWRGAGVLTYRPNQQWAFTAAARYSGMMFTTLDNADVNPNTWQGFGAWFVADLRVHFRCDGRWALSAGIDNALDRKYFLFHPFPQRTYLCEARLSF